MITHIDGILEEKNPAFVVVDVNGIGYMLNISLNTFSALPEKGRVRLFTHLSIREDAHVLFGFHNKEEREMFRHLISVSGVGPSTARIVLSGMNAQECASAIVNEDVGAFKGVKGIGAKTAERIIVDLKNKVDADLIVGEKLFSSNNTIKIEALSALVVLGVDKKKAENIISKAIADNGDDLSVEDLVKLTLKSL
ncbi:MAG: Holliday junction branch migration protein RuvA [Flavobacteriales bacterium]|nr:Holliday junction branch migration protein RuvA [Flavobacteriales bacterium]MCB9196387.1 Holliday junction branch migration protein RuvA [Flavobacteriales bacterium]MCB9198445.1 Holliday junction branch migration protein RuvA [Flavobacteriales bacterium]